MRYGNEGMEGLARERLRFGAEADARARWLADYARANGREAFVLGLSGGKDSTLVGWLARRSGVPLVTLFLGCGSQAGDVEAAREVAAWLGTELVELDLADGLAGFGDALGWWDAGAEPDRVAVGNAKARLRMMAVYAVAQANRGLVLGTGNATESALGYFTKYGDGGYDMNPIADLLWSEVRAMLRWAGVPGIVLDRPSSAGLWEGQTDEGELGIAYADADAFLRHLPVDADAAEDVRRRMAGFADKGNVLNYPDGRWRRNRVP